MGRWEHNAAGCRVLFPKAFGSGLWGAVRKDCTTSVAAVLDLALSTRTAFAAGCAYEKAELECVQRELSGEFKASGVRPEAVLGSLAEAQRKRSKELLDLDAFP
jgi:hypothetical protein